MRRKSKLDSGNNRGLFPIGIDPFFKKYEFNTLVNSELIIESFKIFDENRTDDLDRQEFKKLMIALGSDIDDKQINELYNKVDSDKSGTIDLNEFNSMMINHNFNKNTPVQYVLEKCFDLYDKDNDGYIDMFDLQKVGDEFEEFSASEDLELLVKLVKDFAMEAGLPPNDEPNKINKEEFINAMIKLQFVKETEINKLINQEKQLNQSTPQPDA